MLGQRESKPKGIDRDVVELNEIHEQKMRIPDELLGSYGPVGREYTEPGRDIINGSNHKVPHLAVTSVLCFPFTLFHITSNEATREYGGYMNDMTSLATDVLLSAPFYID